MCIFFAIAFILDQVTQQRYSAILGSAAIVGSVLSVFPALRPATIALGGYGVIWLAFNLVRAVADDAGLAVAGQTVVSRFEATLFGGTLPAQWLQDQFYDPVRIQVHDTALALMHVSFFVWPFMAGVVLWSKRRAVFSTGIAVQPPSPLDWARSGSCSCPRRRPGSSRRNRSRG